MRWERGRRSDNIEDRRGMRVSRKAAGGGLGVLVLALVAMYFGVDPSIVMNSGSSPGGGGTRSVPSGAPSSPQEERMKDFVAVVLADTEDTWTQLFRASGKTYQKPKLVLFSGTVQSACGFAEAASGPFYCPGDSKVYLDLDFFDELARRFGAPGDFAQAYVVAHEIGHHVQNLLGISDQVHQLQRQAGKVEGNKLSVRLELQADCLAGVWANHANRQRDILEAGDVEEALGAATSIGDDRLQKQAGGYITPDAFTHGTSAQRVTWFKRGLTSGNVSECSTFDTASL